MPDGGTSSDTLRERLEDAQPDPTIARLNYRNAFGDVNAVAEDAIEYAAQLEAEVERRDEEVEKLHTVIGNWKHEAETMASAAKACRRMEHERDEARTIARMVHAAAKAVLSESWDDPYNQTPGSKCCEVTPAAWLALDQALRTTEDHHDWLTENDQEDGKDE